MEIVFLGTGAMVPTEKRSQVATLVSIGKENILVDCGEGTQRQFRLAKISPIKLSRILITHWHGDHVVGLPGLLQTMKKGGYVNRLHLYGPKGTSKFFNHMTQSFLFYARPLIHVEEVSGGTVFETEDFIVKAKSVNHSCPCLAYSFIENDKLNIDKTYLKKKGIKSNPLLKDLKEKKDIVIKGEKISWKKATKLVKGRKITFILDTAYTDSVVSFAKDSDILVCEATHMQDLAEKSKKYKHLTSQQAATIAKKSKVKKLVLTHFSQRYTSVNDLLKEAKKVFKNTVCAEDFMKIKL